MKNVILTSLILFAFCLSNNAQTLGKNQHYGTIIDSDGEEIQGVIYLKGGQYPWNKQKQIHFYAADTLNFHRELKKKDFEKFQPKNLKGYSFNGRKFNVIDYTNLSGAAQGKASGINRISQISKSLTKSLFFAEVAYASEDFAVYKFYNEPASFTVSSGKETEELRENRQNSMNEYTVLIERKEEKAKLYESIRIKTYFEDCPMVVEKYNDGLYTKKPMKKSIGISIMGGLDGEGFILAATEMIEDYKANCGN